MYCTIWEFFVDAGSREEFVAAYGSEGLWAELFRRSPGYLRTDLLVDQDDPERFLTADYWDSRAHFEELRTLHGAEYEALDARLDHLTLRETSIGHFSMVAHSGCRGDQASGSSARGSR